MPMPEGPFKPTVPGLVETAEEIEKGKYILETKTYRKELDAILQRIKESDRTSRERSLAITKFQEAIMWLGMDLKDLGTPNLYPNSYDPSNAIVEPTADDLKL